MNILVFNCGSSSLKYKLLNMPSESLIAGGEAQRVGTKTAEQGQIIHTKNNGYKKTFYADMPNHFAAFEKVMAILQEQEHLMPDAVGHRVVHGGEIFSEPAVITDPVIEQLEGIQHLAPIHNPPALILIQACTALYPQLPQVAVFDTAYHTTIPDYAYTYPLPKTLSKELEIRKYGFHGTSHKFVVDESARFLGVPLAEFNAVSCHIGSGGASLCAVIGGKSVDNTMGFSPLQGLVMSTRCGDIDPAVTLKLLSRAHGNTEQVEKLLNTQSGVLGFSGFSSDIRDILAAALKKTDSCAMSGLTADLYLWRIRKYLGAYCTIVGQPHALIFTDTIGETVPYVRWAVCSNMESFGIHIDPEKNMNALPLPTDIAAPSSPVRIVVVLTNEELAISRLTYQKCA